MEYLTIVSHFDIFEETQTQMHIEWQTFVYWILKKQL